MAERKKILSSKDFIKYLKKIDFPNKRYDAVTSYPDTEIVNGKPINIFNQKYRQKKFLYDHMEKNEMTNNNSDLLLSNSFNYISNFQNNLLQRNLETYIAGGAALRLYYQLTLGNTNPYAKTNRDKKFLLTKDYDLYLYYDEKKITNKIILSNVHNIVDSVVDLLKNPNYLFIEIYMLVHFENTKKFNEILQILLDDGYDLNTYVPNSEKDVYTFKFLKIINKELCIRLKIKFLKIDALLKEGIYSYNKVTVYYIKKTDKSFEVVNKFIPIELLIKNKSKSNLEIMKSSIVLRNKVFYIYNENTLLYNLMHLYYKYHFNTENITITRKKEEGKNVRDEARLNFFFKVYCKLKYSQLSENDMNDILKKLKASEKKFVKSIENIKDFKVIDKLFEKY